MKLDIMSKNGLKIFTLLFVISLIFTINTNAQDTIVKRNGNIIKCKFQRMDDTNVYFIFHKNDKIDTTYINKSEIQLVKYDSVANYQTPLIYSFLNVEMGFGPNFGILGLKTVLGWQNSGLLIGYGRTPVGTFGCEIGFQIAISSFYVNYGVAVVGAIKLDNEEIKSYSTNYITIGVMFDLGKNNRTFIDLGLGLRTTTPMGYSDNYHQSIEDHVYSGAIGIGYRFGKRSKTHIKISL